MSYSPKISILIPIYNVERYLGKCLDSVFKQSYQNIEYVFVDDCSSDSSVDVLMQKIKEYGVDDNHYVLLKHQENMGIAYTRANLVSMATGDYILFVDSDDWIESNMIELMASASDNGTIDLIACDFFWEYSDGTTKVQHDNYANDCYENLLKSIDYTISPVLWRLLTKRELYDGLTIAREINVGEDYIITIKLFFLSKSFRYISFPLYHYFQHSDVQRLTVQKSRCLNDHIKAVNEVERFLKDNGYLTSDVENLLNRRKFNIKSNYLTKRYFDIEKFENCFPEAKYSWRGMGYSFRECVKFWLAENKLYYIIKLLS